jgi:hypothetical protein
LLLVLPEVEKLKLFKALQLRLILRISPIIAVPASVNMPVSKPNKLISTTALSFHSCAYMRGRSNESHSKMNQAASN